MLPSVHYYHSTYIKGKQKSNKCRVQMMPGSSSTCIEENKTGPSETQQLNG